MPCNSPQAGARAEAHTGIPAPIQGLSGETHQELYREPGNISSGYLGKPNRELYTVYGEGGNISSGFLGKPNIFKTYSWEKAVAI
jgi:hypothetical protein